MNQTKPEVLVVGGAGYIGSHMVHRLQPSEYRPVVFDNFSSGRPELLPPDVEVLRGDLKDGSDVEKAFAGRRFEAVMHFAASIEVGESVKDPLKYYENNVLSCIRLLKVMKKNALRKFIFSSTAAVYGEPKRVPIEEDDEKKPANPYGRTKLMIEEILKDAAAAGDLSYVVLRYFNASGAHSNGLTGESHDPESHLIPNVLKAVTGEKEFTMFGRDYDTPDGTCVRDYVHVEDIAEAHLKALRAMEGAAKNQAFNLGSGSGYSVLEILKEAEKVTGKPVPVKTGPRRPGDSAKLVASFKKVEAVLGWKPEKSLNDILSSAWKWELKRKASK